MERKIKLDWNKWFSRGTELPKEVVRDKETGLERCAVSRRGFERYIKLMTGEINEEEARKKGIKWTRASKERFEKQLLEGLQLVLLSDEEIYNLNPEFYEEMGMVSR